MRHYTHLTAQERETIMRLARNGETRRFPRWRSIQRLGQRLGI